MAKESKTARASAVVMKTDKKVIPDEEYIKDLRNNIASGLHVTQESAKALLRAYDAALLEIQALKDAAANDAFERDLAST